MRPAGNVRLPAVASSTARPPITVSRLVVLGLLAFVLTLLAAAIRSAPASADTTTRQAEEQPGPDQSPDAESPDAEGPDAVVRVESDGAAIVGEIAYGNGDPAIGIEVNLFTDGTRSAPDRFLRPAFTNGDGGFQFSELAADCYFVVLDAPGGAAFGDGEGTSEHYTCLDPGQTDRSIAETLTTGRPGDPFTLNLLHIGDHHSHLDPDRLVLQVDGEPTELEVGGMARVATKMDELTAALGPETVQRIHTGDSLSGTMVYTVFGGAADAAAMNSVCFDLVGLGGQDLSQGQDRLDAFIDFLADGPCEPELVSAELEAGRPSAANDAGPKTVRRIGDGAGGNGLVGFVSVPLPHSSPNPDLPLDEQALAELSAFTQAQIDRLLERGIANIVLLTNIGLDNDTALVQTLSDVDAVVGGGSHSLLGDFSSLGLEVDGRYPAQATNRDGQSVCIGHAWQYARVVGQLGIDFDGTGGVSSCDGEAHLLLATVEQEPTTASTIEGYTKALSELSSEPLGMVTEELCFTRTPSRTVGLLCSADVIGDGDRRPADVQLLIAAAIKNPAGANVGLVNSGVVDRGIGSGPLLLEDTYRVLAGDHTVSLLQMTGAEIAATIEEAITSALAQDGSPGAYPHIAGLRWTFDGTAPTGSRIDGLQVGADEPGAWVPLAADETYSVATSGFLAAGGDGYRTLATVLADGRATKTFIEYPQA
ncbi:MAG: bifunctional metallophosphatase/5'-nucleotidase, partial [Acidimicrobiales bacterium]